MALFPKTETQLRGRINPIRHESGKYLLDIYKKYKPLTDDKLLINFKIVNCYNCVCLKFAFNKNSRNERKKISLKIISLK